MSDEEKRAEYYVDPARRKSVRSSPEETVRQALISYLTTTLSIPLGLISVEKEIASSNEIIRADIVIYDRRGAPWMVVECKAPDVKLTQSAFDQIARYNAHLMAPYLLVSNGTEHFAWEWDAHSHAMKHLIDLPQFPVDS